MATADEPSSLTQIATDDAFGKWLIGTEWEFTSSVGKRRIWFVSPGVAIYSRLNVGGTQAAPAFSWSASKRGFARMFYETTDKDPFDMEFSSDLKTMKITRIKKENFVAQFLRRKGPPPPPNMSEVDFKKWVPGKSVRFGSTTYSFKEGSVLMRDEKGERTLKTSVVGPGLISYYWGDNPRDVTLFVVSPDLKQMQFYVWWGSSKMADVFTLGSNSPAGAPAVNQKTGKSEEELSMPAPVSMSDLKPIPIKAQAARVNALLVMPLGFSRFAGSASALSLSSLPKQGGKPATINFNQSVGRSMQKALQEVCRYQAIRHGGWPVDQEMQLSFEDKFGGKDGPSAAVACGLLLESAITGTPLDPSFAVTGDLNADGSVQPIGGVHAKLRGATNLKCQLLAIPEKNAPHAVDLAISEGIRPFLTIQVFSIAMFDDAFKLASGTKSADLTAAIAEYAKIAQNGLATPSSLKSAETLGRLRSILQRVPNHVSCQILLQHLTGKLSAFLTPSGTLAEMDQAIGDLQTAIDGDVTAKTLLDGGQVAKANGAFTRLRPIADPRTKTYLDAWVAWGGVAERIAKSNGPRSAKETKEWMDVCDRIGIERRKLFTNEGFREDLK